MNNPRSNYDFIKLTFRRAFGFPFICSILCICVCFFLDTEISARNVLLGRYSAEAYDGLSLYFENILMFGTNYKLYLVFMTMGYAILLPLDWEAGVVSRIVKDLGTKKYATIQIGTAALTGGFSVLGGYLLYVLWMRTKYPLLPNDYRVYGIFDYLTDMPYYETLSHAAATEFIVYMGIIFFLSGVTWTAVAAGISIYVKSHYIVLIFPYILSRMYIEIAKVFRLPDEVRIDRWFDGMAQPFEIPICLAMILLFCLAVCFLSKQIFAKSIRWRLKNGEV